MPVWSKAVLESAERHRHTPRGRAEEALRILERERAPISREEFDALREALRSAPQDVQERPAEEQAKWAVEQCAAKLAVEDQREDVRSASESSPPPETVNGYKFDAEQSQIKLYAHNCWDTCRRDDDPAKYDTWLLVEEADGHPAFYLNLRTGQQRTEFPGNCVHARQLYRCLGCNCIFSALSYGYQMHARGHAHLGGELPAGPIPHPQDLEDKPEMCPSLVVTPAADECKETDSWGRHTNYETIYHYVTLRERTSGMPFVFENESDVPFLQDVTWDEFSTHPRIQRAEQILQLQQNLQDSYVARDVARNACAKAEKEVATLKGIIANLMAVRTPGPVHQQPAPAVQAAEAVQ